MGRALTMQRKSVPDAERASYIAALRERRRACAAAECRFWVFEADGAPGQFVEFTEAKDAALLRAALGNAPDHARVPWPLYNEVELD